MAEAKTESDLPEHEDCGAEYDDGVEMSRVEQLPRNSTQKKRHHELEAANPSTNRVLIMWP